MHARVAGQFWMERGREDVALANHDALSIPLRQQLDLGAASLDPRRADEDRRKRRFTERVDRKATSSE